MDYLDQDMVFNPVVDCQNPRFKQKEAIIVSLKNLRDVLELAINGPRMIFPDLKQSINLDHQKDYQSHNPSPKETMEVHGEQFTWINEGE